MSESSNHDRNRRNSLRMLATAPLLLAGAASAQPGKAPARADGPRVAWCSAVARRAASRISA